MIASQDDAGHSFFDLTRWRRKPLSGGLATALQRFGDQIRKRCLELGLSQRQLGEWFGVGRLTVYRWERGQCQPPAQFRAAIERFLRSAMLMP